MKAYTTPELEIIEFETEDVIEASPTDLYSDWPLVPLN